MPHSRPRLPDNADHTPQPLPSVESRQGRRPQLLVEMERRRSPAKIIANAAPVRYLHSLIGYCNPADTPMKTLLPALQRAMQLRTSALHLALKLAACAP